MTWAKQPCKYCKTIIYWNSLDKTMKETGSWHEFDTNLLHTWERCQADRNENREQDEIFNAIMEDQRGLNF